MSFKESFIPLIIFPTSIFLVFIMVMGDIIVNNWRMYKRESEKCKNNIQMLMDCDIPRAQSEKLVAYKNVIDSNGNLEVGRITYNDLKEILSKNKGDSDEFR